MLPILRAYAGRESEVQDEVLMGRALACLRWTSQTTCGDGAAMERWSTLGGLAYGSARGSRVGVSLRIAGPGRRPLVRADFRTSLQRMGGVGVSSKSTPVARLLPRTGGGDDA